MKFEELQGQATAIDKRGMCLCVCVSARRKCHSSTWRPHFQLLPSVQIKKAWQQAIHPETCKIHSFKVHCFPLYLTRPSKPQQFITIWLILYPISLLQEVLCENGNQLVPLFAPNSKQLVSEPRVTVFPFAVISWLFARLSGAKLPLFILLSQVACTHSLPSLPMTFLQVETLGESQSKHSGLQLYLRNYSLLSDRIRCCRLIFFYV